MKTTDTLIRPRLVREGAHLSVLAISGPSDEPRIRAAAETLRARGYRVTISDAAFSSGPRAYLAGDDLARVTRLNDAFADPSFDAFLFTRGGYGAMRILDSIDYDAVRANPRPIIGYSDITALLQAIAAVAGVSTFHGPMLNTDFNQGLSPQIESWMWRVLGGEAPITFSFERSNILAAGAADGVLFGGCLSLTTALIGTPYDYWVNDGIWFWEDVGESLYKIDRMLTHLRLSGRFHRLRGMIVGQLRECSEDRPGELDSLLLEFFGDLGIPLVRGLPFGHFGNNLMLPIGQRIQFDTSDCSLTLPEPVVR